MKDPTTLQMSAVMFVKTMADYIDKQAGRPPTRETQKRAAKTVREMFFSEADEPEQIEHKPEVKPHD